MITNYENSLGQQMVKIENEDGSCTCFTKEQYEAYLEQAKQSTPSVIDEA